MKLCDIKEAKEIKELQELRLKGFCFRIYLMEDEPYVPEKRVAFEDQTNNCCTFGEVKAGEFKRLSSPESVIRFMYGESSPIKTSSPDL